MKKEKYIKITLTEKDGKYFKDVITNGFSVTEIIGFMEEVKYDLLQGKLKQEEISTDDSVNSMK